MEIITLSKPVAIILGLLAATGLLANIAFVIILFFIVRRGGLFSVGFIEEEENDR